jgi:thiol-disulfide isomerase/thioredoxin
VSPLLRQLGIAVLISLMTAVPSAMALAGQTQVHPFTRDSLVGIRAARTGQPFIIKFWSLDCAPCRAELPQWDALTRRHPRLDLVLVNVDGAAHADEAARLLDEHGLGRHEYWIFAHPFPQQLRLAIDPNWYGELPRTYFYSPDHSHHAVSGKLSAEQVERWICAHGLGGNAENNTTPGASPGTC